jgi:hypothetical protein
VQHQRNWVAAPKRGFGRPPPPATPTRWKVVRWEVRTRTTLCRERSAVDHFHFLHGHALTLQHVLPAGVEVGQYAGFVRSLRSLQQTRPDSIPPRVERNLAAMEECLLQFPLYDPLVSPAEVLGWFVRVCGGRGGGASMAAIVA